MIVDNFHLVGFNDTCQYQVQKFGGWKETLLGGEGLVTHITGPGEVLIQTKDEVNSALASPPSAVDLRVGCKLIAT
jgi:uncharacterized protein (AIM24 family)